MSKKLSFGLPEFEEAQSVILKMQDEFSEFVKEEIQHTQSFKGSCIKKPTNATCGKAFETIFETSITVGEITANLQFYLEYKVSWPESSFCLEKLEFNCPTLGISSRAIDCKDITDFTIYYEDKGILKDSKVSVK